MAAPTKIRLASRCYDGVLPIFRGQIRIPGFDLEIIETENVAGMFGGMFKGHYDVSEMSLAELIYYTSRNQANFIAVPVFPSRMFRHGLIFCRKASGIGTPAELSGKKLGFQRWVQTAAIWMRGMLVEEYGVSARKASGTSHLCIIGTLPTLGWPCGHAMDRPFDGFKVRGKTRQSGPAALCLTASSMRSA